VTDIQGLQYAIYGLEAELAGKRLELEMVQGESANLSRMQ